MMTKFDQKTLVFFLSADLLFVFLHIVLGFMVMKGWVSIWPDFFNIGRDWSAGEILNYIKWVLIIFTVMSIYLHRRVPVFLGLAIFFLIALFDDSLQLHERGATWLIENTPMYDLFGTDQGVAGELVIWTFLGILSVSCLAIGWIMSPPEECRRIVPVMLLFFGVVFCAVVLDVLHHKLPTPRSLFAGLLGILEDGGEMVMLTFLLAYVRGGLKSAITDEQVGLSSKLSVTGQS
ncbi:hypothetical protein [Labrenzia sp. PHM005]|uniref:hypothetical protein n=1 Tax=Labrenzia sp. PHM005 TaxID=2590016 RepID=UPI0011407910|nr:hypothetical protein [Labrenzia sp. PHM005]QDG74938.1 hypothetical protein FJ695_03130 [Labrenzia sp. PHM005]